MTFITSPRSEVLVDWHQHIGSLIGELRESSLFPIFETDSSQQISDLKIKRSFCWKRKLSLNCQYGSSPLYTEKWASRQSSKSLKQNKLKKKKKQTNPCTNTFTIKSGNKKECRSLFLHFAYFTLRNTCLDKMLKTKENKIT